jgi:hypothetical protein
MPVPNGTTKLPLIDCNRVWGRVVEDIPAYNRLLIERLSR